MRIRPASAFVVVMLSGGNVLAQSAHAADKTERQPAAGGAQPSAAAGRSQPAAAPAAPTAAGEAVQEEPPKVTGGYSWSDPPRQRQARRRRPALVDPDAPVATFTGFRLLPDGSSLAWVSISKRVTVRESVGQHALTYELPGVIVRVWNNTHPLLTGHFPTRVQQMRLQPGKEGARLRIDLREPAQPRHEIIDGPGGSVVLRIHIPGPDQLQSVTTVHDAPSVATATLAVRSDALPATLPDPPKPESAEATSGKSNRKQGRKKKQK